MFMNIGDKAIKIIYDVGFIKSCVKKRGRGELGSRG